MNKNENNKLNDLLNNNFKKVQSQSLATGMTAVYGLINNKVKDINLMTATREELVSVIYDIKVTCDKGLKIGKDFNEKNGVKNNK